MGFPALASSFPTLPVFILSSAAIFVLLCATVQSVAYALVAILEQAMLGIARHIFYLFKSRHV